MKLNNPNYLNGLKSSVEQINAAVEGGGAGLTPEQTTTLDKLEDITSSASEIDRVAKNKMKLIKGKVIEDFSSTTGFTLLGTGGATATLVTEANPFSSTSIKFETTINAGSLQVNKTLASPISLMQCETLSIYVYSPNLGGFSNSAVRLRNTASKYFEYSFKSEMFGTLNPEWHHLKIPISKLSATGSITVKDLIKEITIIGYGNSGATMSLYFAGIVIDNKQNKAISFTFDDNNITDYTVAYNKMKEYGFKGTSYIISEAAGTGLDVRMSLAQMQEMYEYGWKFGMHGKDSLNWVDETTIEQAETSIKACRDWLYDNGFKGNGLKSVAYPQGKYNDSVISVLKKLGITHGRTTIPNNSYYPMEDIYKIRGMGQGGSLAEKIAKLDDAMQNNCHVCFIGHTITDVDDFNGMIDYIAENYADYVTTLPDWAEAYIDKINEV